MGGNMNSINDLIDYLIIATKASIKNLLNEADDVFEIVSKYQKDFVSNEKLIMLLKRSQVYKDIQYFLIDIFFYIEEESITDNFVDLCLKYPGSFKKTLLIQLSHIWLTEKQLLKLHFATDTPEAFYKLVLLYLKDNSCSVDKLSTFLLSNIKHIGSIYNYKEHIRNFPVNNKKIDLLDQLLIQYKK